MEPIAVTIRGERRWMLIHRCTRCGRLRMNRTAADDNVLLLSRTSARPPRLPKAPDPYSILPEVMIALTPSGPSASGRAASHSPAPGGTPGTRSAADPCVVLEDSYV